jgi:hypothetical protein
LNSTFTINVEGTPLRVTLAQVLAQLGLAFAVKDDVLIISSPEGIERGSFETVARPRLLTPRTKAVLAQLEEPVSMGFANETPLEDVLKYLTQATTTATALGIPFVVDAFGLQETRTTLQSTISMDLEGVPLKSTLRLLLKQLGLVYTIKDGLVVISSPQVIQKLEKSTAEEPRGKTSPPPRGRGGLPGGPIDPARPVAEYQSGSSSGPQGRSPAMIRFGIAPTGMRASSFRDPTSSTETASEPALET